METNSTAGDSTINNQKHFPTTGWSLLQKDIDVFSQSLVGRRVLNDDLYLGTVLYVGGIPNSKGVWLGVDWDEPERGRHNGTHNGKKYFETKHPTSGSFVRPNKVSFGKSIEHIIDLQYGNRRNELIHQTIESSKNLQERDKNTESSDIKIELFGPLANLPSLNLTRLKSAHFQGSSVVASEGKMDGLLPNLKELNIARSMITSWFDIAEICRYLPSLETLNVSDNFLPYNEDAFDDCDVKSSFQNVNKLVLVRLGYSFPRILKILENCFPKISNLIIALNDLKTINFEPLSTSILQLTLLDIIGNDLDNFEKTILPLGKLEQLHTLLISENNFEKIKFPGAIKEKTALFPKLTCLCVGKNKIADWNSIVHFNRLPCLKELQIWDNPIDNSRENPAMVRSIMIAHLRTIKILNRSDILPMERRQAELDYVKIYGKQYLDCLESETTRELFELEHPYYKELSDKHGAPCEDEYKDLTVALKEGLIGVTIKCPSLPNSKIINRKLPNRMTVHHVMALVRRLYKLSASQSISLYYTTDRLPGSEYYIDSETREFGFYGVETGDTLLIKLSDAKNA